jgi:hypothetical protein
MRGGLTYTFQFIAIFYVGRNFCGGVHREKRDSVAASIALIDLSYLTSEMQELTLTLTLLLRGRYRRAPEVTAAVLTHRAANHSNKRSLFADMQQEVHRCHDGTLGIGSHKKKR